MIPADFSIRESSFIEHCEVFDSLPSTNDYAVQLARRQPVTRTTLIVANKQAKGRGRGNHAWHSSAGSLTFSLLLPRDLLARCLGNSSRGLGPISILTAIATLEGLQPFTARCLQLKWPNDILLDGGKLAGILIETVFATQPAVVVGIGINVTNQLPGLPNADQQAVAPFPPRNLVLADSVGPALPDVLRSVLNSLEARWFGLPHIGADFVQTFGRYDAFYDRPVCVITESATYSGIGRGIDEEGRLLVDTDEQLIRLTSGTVRFPAIGSTEPATNPRIRQQAQQGEQ